MGQPSFFDNVREWIGGIAFAIYLWSVKMSDEEFWNEQERHAAQQSAHVNLASPFCPHISQSIDGTCPYCVLPKPPGQ